MRTVGALGTDDDLGAYSSFFMSIRLGPSG